MVLIWYTHFRTHLLSFLMVCYDMWTLFMYQIITNHLTTLMIGSIIDQAYWKPWQTDHHEEKGGLAKETSSDLAYPQSDGHSYPPDLKPPEKSCHHAKHEKREKHTLYLQFGYAMSHFDSFSLSHWEPWMSGEKMKSRLAIFWPVGQGLGKVLLIWKNMSQPDKYPW